MGEDIVHVAHEDLEMPRPMTLYVSNIDWLFYCSRGVNLARMKHINNICYGLLPAKTI
jgi:hypothetical protein